MRIQRERYRFLIASGAVFLSASGVAYAESGASTSHMPVLWAMVVGGAMLSATVPHVLKRFANLAWPVWGYWVASIVLALAFLILAGPIIIVLGSILMTGRTM